MKKFAIILAGCGVYDGSEIHEAVMSMYAVMKNGAEYQLFAPDIQQHHVVNHLTGAEMPETRNVLVESARIARGNILSLNKLNLETDAANVKVMGAKHIATNHGEVIIDEKHRLFSTPCYQLESTIVQIAEGADNLVKAMLKTM